LKGETNVSRTSFASIADNWKKLLTAANENASDLPQLEPIRTNLQTALDRAQALSSERDSLRARLNQLSRDLESVLIQGKDAAIQLRSGVRSQYGATSERLVQFLLKPIRRKLRVERVKKKAAAGEQPPATAPQQPPAVPQQPGTAKQLTEATAPPPATAG
jgi:ElaB/YqjD/DUF883 family membrane-anchored ribosome-binding protein